MSVNTHREDSKLVEPQEGALDIEDPNETEPSRSGRRFLILFMVFWGTLFATQGRLILSISILVISEESRWDEIIQGVILGSFGMGYFWTQFPSIWIERKIGSKLALVIAVGLGGPFVLFFPFAVPNVGLSAFCYVAVGLLQGPLWVANYSVILDWFPTHERSSALSSLTAASILGTASALGLTPLVITAWGWKSCFFLCGGLDIIWAIIWLVIGKSSPEAGEYDILPIPQAELQYILTTRAERRPLTNIPWKALLTYPAVLVCFFNQFANNYGYYVLVSWAPTFLKRQLGYDLKSTGLFSVLPYILQGFLSQFAAYFADNMLKRGYVTKYCVRKVGQSIGLLTPAIGLCLISFVDLSAPQVVALITLGIAVNGVVSIGYQMSYLDMSTTYASIIFAIGNTFSSLNASVSVYFVGLILEETNFNWSVVWMIGAVMWLLSLVLFIAIVPVEEVDFDKLAKEDEAQIARGEGLFGKHLHLSIDLPTIMEQRGVLSFHG